MPPNVPRTSGAPAAALAPGRLRARVFVTLAVLFVLFLATGVAALWYRRDQAIEEARQRADNLALILGEHFRRSVDAIDATLAQLALHSQRVGGPTAPAELWNPVLAATRLALSGVGSLNVTDASGTITASTIPALVGEPRGDQFLFRELAGNPQSGLVADTPFRSIRDGHMFIPIGRRLTAPDGAFTGIVAVTLEPEGLRGFYQSVNVGPNGMIHVLHPTGLVLFQEPSHGELIGQPAEKGAQAAGACRAGGSGAYCVQARTRRSRLYQRLPYAVGAAGRHCGFARGKRHACRMAR